MLKFLTHQKYMMALCLVAALSLSSTACSDDDAPSNNDNNTLADVRDDWDIGEEDITHEGDTSDEEDVSEETDASTEGDVTDAGDVGDEGDVTDAGDVTDVTDEGDVTDIVDEGSFCDDVDAGIEVGLETNAQFGDLDESGAIGVLAGTSADETTQLYTRLRVELYGDTVIAPSPTPYVAGGTYPVDDYNYASCLQCVIIQTGCDVEGDCETSYNARAGELTVDAFDAQTGEFKATLSNAEFVEVTQGGDANLESTIVANGGGWCIDSYAIDLVLDVAEPR